MAEAIVSLLADKDPGMVISEQSQGHFEGYRLKAAPATTGAGRMRV